MSDKPDTAGMEYLQTLPRRWVTLYIPLGVFMFVLLFPFYWMVMTSFKSNEELMSKAANPFWIVKPTLDHFEKLLFRTEYPQWLWNTILVSVLRSEEHTSELQSHSDLVCRLLLEKKKKKHASAESKLQSLHTAHTLDMITSL